MVLCVHLKGLSFHVFHEDLVHGLDPNAVAHKTMTRYPDEAGIAIADVTADPEASSPHIHNSDRAMLAALEDKAVSVRARI
jgi:hypothetical protein